MPAFELDLGLQRDGGLTHVLDKGLGPRGWADVLEMSGDYIDIVKLGWGTSYVTKNLERKLDVLKEKPVVIGGTFFEVVYVKGAFDDYKRWLTSLGLTHVEISDGTIEIPRERKLELIADFARDFTVLSEVGSKDSEVVFAPYEWVEWIKEEKDAGAWKVITEAREGGTVGHLPAGRPDAHRPDRGDRALGRLPRPRLGGADEVVSGVVHQALRPLGQPREHPAGGSDPARDAPARPARRHAEGGAPR